MSYRPDWLTSFTCIECGLKFDVEEGLIHRQLEAVCRAVVVVVYIEGRDHEVEQM